MQLLLDAAVGAVSVEIVHLGGVLLKVVELPGVDVVAVEMNEFIAVDLHLLGGCGGTSLVVVVEVVRQGQLCVIEGPEVLQVRHPGAVGRLVVQQQAERPVGVALVLEPVEGQVGGDVGGVAGDDAALAVIYKGGVVVLALSDEDVPVVEAGGVGGQVPLADDGGLVAGLAQELGEGLLAAVEGAGVVGESVLVAVLG